MSWIDSVLHGDVGRVHVVRDRLGRVACGVQTGHSAAAGTCTSCVCACVRVYGMRSCACEFVVSFVCALTWRLSQRNCVRVGWGVFLAGFKQGMLAAGHVHFFFKLFLLSFFGTQVAITVALAISLIEGALFYLYYFLYNLYGHFSK